jgi:hypothetical protein
MFSFVLHKEMFKGILTQDLQLQVLSINQFTPDLFAAGEPFRTTGEKAWHSV